jgi:DNA-directed RNA polymerase subunit L
MEFKTNNVIVNTIRRVILRQVPNYAFDPKNIKFSKNTSIYNNDLLRVRISNMPVMGLINDDKTFKEYLENNYTWVVNTEKNVEQESDKTKVDIDSIYENDTSIELLQDTNVLTMYCYATHKDKKVEFMNITTDMCEFFINEKKIDSPYKYPLLILKLRYNEEIEFSASSKMSIPFESPIYSSVENVHFTEENGVYKFTVIPRNSSLKESVIIKRAIKIIKEMLSVAQTLIDTISTEQNKGTLEINNDKFTLAALLTNYLQENKDVTYAGYHCEHLLGNKSVINYVLKDSAKIQNVLKDISKVINKELDKLKF